MQISRTDLADFVYFMAIAKHRSFRKAAAEMGVTTSALSHAMRSLEARRGVRLLNRTTRSVALTAAGEELRAQIEHPLERIGQAADNLDRYRDVPAGRVRVSVPEDAVALLLDSVMPVFTRRYPEITIDISVNNRLIDVIDGGFDAGIRYGGTVPEDMIAQRLSPDLRWVTAASPSYLDRFGIPESPDDLLGHHCIRIRLGDERLYDWEFDRDGEEISIAAPGQITVDASHAALGFAIAGVGIVYGVEAILKPHLESGELAQVLAEWAPMGGGFHVYYSGRRQLPSGLRLLIDVIKEINPLG